MVDTVNDLILTGVGYQDVYAGVSIIVGTPLVVQNKSAGPVYLQISASSPLATDKDGRIVYPGKEVFVTGATTGLWAIGNGRLHVEEDA